MKIIVVGIAGGLLLCTAAATGGYYVGKSAKPVSRVLGGKGQCQQGLFHPHSHRGES